MKLPILLLTSATLVSTTNALSAEAKVKDPSEVCRYSGGNGWNRQELHGAVRCVTSKWHVPGGVRRAARIINCESGWGIHASNSCCHGLLALHESYFGGWFRRFNPHRGWKLQHAIENPRTNLTIGLRLAHAQGWGSWSCA